MKIMPENDPEPKAPTYYVDETGDGVLFGQKGRNRLEDPGANQFFILGMVSCEDEIRVADAFSKLRAELLANPLYASIPSMLPASKKTAKAFHAKDDHPEIRAKVFELIVGFDFKFYAVIKDMRKVLEYVQGRNRMNSDYRYHPNELYDLTVRMLFKQRLHKEDHYRVCFARRGKSDRTKALRTELEQTRHRFLEEHSIEKNASLEICPLYSWEHPCLQLTDYCLWALQRCYEKYEDRFLKAIWSKVSLIHDVDNPLGKNYGTYLTRKKSTPDTRTIKSRWL